MSIGLENAMLYEDVIKAQEEAAMANKAMSELLSRLQHEMAMARETQESILPSELPQQSGYEFGAKMIPANAVGGDFFQFIELDKDRLGVVIGDVSDKGLPAALFMALTYSLMRAEASRTLDPREVLLSVNRYLCTMDASSYFVTVLYGILNYNTGDFCFARAGHFLPVVLDQNGNGVRMPYSEGMALGLTDAPVIAKHRLITAPGGIILLYSDGLSEAADPGGCQFGTDRIYADLATHRHESAQSICESLWKSVEVHCGEESPQDDFTTVVIKRKA
jgi:serine phosphatase RsbU (regulator of sigma subunit)